MNLSKFLQGSQQLRSHSSDKLLFILISAFLAVYLVIRATLVPMAHDEIATFYYFVQSGKFNPFFSNIDTNNHFLNSVLTWISYRLFGSSPLALRLPNLMFIPAFFFFLYGIVQNLISRIFRFVLFITLAFTLHFIEFLALSRGYGMSMALLLGSVYFLFEGIKNQKIRSYIFSLVCIFLASIANLALINTYALVLFLVSVIVILKNQKNLIPGLLAIFLAGILPFSMVVAQILYIKAHAGLIAGSPNNFWDTTITSLVAFLFETSNYNASRLALLLFSAITLTSVLTFLKLKISGFKKFRFPSIFVYLLVGNIMAILTLRFFFNVNYPDDRIGLYLYPLIAGSLIFMLDILLINSKWKLAVAVLFVVVPLHFIVYANTSYSIWYKYDVIPERFYERVMQNHKTGTPPPTIAGHGMRIFCWSYLDYRHGGEASQFFFTHFPDYNADFQIVNIKMIPGWQQFYDTIDYDAPSERHLLKLRKPHQYNTLIASRIKKISRNRSQFIPILEGPADTLRNKILKVDINLSLFAKTKPFNGRIVFDVSDKKHHNLRYEYIQFNWLRNCWDGSVGNFSNCMLVYKIPPEAAEYKIYIWNIDTTEFDVSEGFIRINEVL